MAVEVKKPAGETKVAVIGGGPGGYVAAIRAAQLGGFCLKYLFHSGEHRPIRP